MGEIAEALPALVRRWKYVEGVPVFLDRRIRGAFTQRNKTTNGLMALALYFLINGDWSVLNKITRNLSIAVCD
jgi:hypothetical protein